jgi:hypothetical protein
VCDYCRAGYELTDNFAGVPFPKTTLTENAVPSAVQPTTFCRRGTYCKPCEVGWYSQAGGKCAPYPTGTNTTSPGSSECKTGGITCPSPAPLVKYSCQLWCSAMPNCS